ncbi:ABC transporter ATP-binding protein [Pandoraea sputorum]|uniref:ABC transporter ATP-binding protein n=1 Tax=Pandoraea sputorum TaxID=93222 RepID=UPI0012413281|nr:ABC transporter ATP-binding protein [Pandoraea sputorum]VVE55087.1 Spermidine/putrescine import ATP-binding protein PotA [Pandoraea sputorum]
MIEFIDVYKAYADVQVLSRINLKVHRGEFLTLLGPSGSGKTTLLNIASGLLKPSAGTVLIDGKDAANLRPGERGLGMVFQNYALMPHMTVFENIAFPLRVRKVPQAEIRQRVSDVLKQVRLPNVETRKPKELSGGQQQRVSLARCIVYSPALILMDEPLGALDKKLREQMQFEIKQLHAELGITMINVTHDQEEALTLSDRIVLMNQGEVEQEGTPTELYQNPRTVFAGDFIGEGNFLDGTLRAGSGELAHVQACGAELRCRRPQASLCEGSPVKVLVRPENLSIREVGALGQGPGDAMHNALPGKIIDNLVLGGVVKHRLLLDAGKELFSQQANRLGSRVFERGERVEVTFSPQSATVLP